MSHIARLVDAYGNLTITQSSSTLIWNSRSTIQSTADGYITLQNNAGTNFSALRFGGVTSSFPSLYNNGAALEARLADGSAYTNINLNILNAMGQGSGASPAIRIGGNATGVLGFYSPGTINNTFQALGVAQNGAGILTLDTLGGGLQYNSIGAAASGHFFYSNGGSAAFISSSFLDVFGTVSALRFRAAGGSAIGGTTTQYGWTNASTGNSGSLDTAITRNAAGVITITTGSGQTPTGTLIVAAGTTTTPGVAVGTTSNGVYAPTTNQIAITTNNTQAMLWDASQNTTIPSGSSFIWNARSKIVSSADGYITLQNNAGTAFSGLRFGGTTSSFSAIYTNGLALEARLADGSSYADFNAQNISLNRNLYMQDGYQITFGTDITGPNSYNGQAILIGPVDPLTYGTTGTTYNFGGSSIAIGAGARIQTNNGATVDNNVVIGTLATVLYNSATGQSAFRNTVIGAQFATAQGFRNICVGNGAYAAGSQNISIGDYCGVGGPVFGGSPPTYSTVVFSSSIAIGKNASVQHNSSIAFGSTAATTADHQIMLGTNLETTFLRGGVNHNQVTKTANYTLTSFDYTIFVDATSGNVALTLPDATLAVNLGKVFNILRKDNTSNTVTLNTTSSQNINGALTYTGFAQYTAITVQNDGSNWFII